MQEHPLTQVPLWYTLICLFRMHITHMSCLTVHTPSNSDHSKHFKLDALVPYTQTCVYSFPCSCSDSQSTLLASRVHTSMYASKPNLHLTIPDMPLGSHTSHLNFYFTWTCSMHKLTWWYCMATHYYSTTCEPHLTHPIKYLLCGGVQLKLCLTHLFKKFCKKKTYILLLDLVVPLYMLWCFLSFLFSFQVP